MHAAKLLPVREGQTYLQPIEQLTSYWLEMQKLGKELLPVSGSITLELTGRGE